MRFDAHASRAVFNKDYLKWTSENIKAIQYEALPGAYLSRWDAVLEAVGSGRPEVVMVTQSTVSRCGLRDAHVTCMQPLLV